MLLPARAPAHLALSPSQDRWEQVSAKSAASICVWSGFKGDVERLKTETPEPHGYYRVLSESGPSFFIKILSCEALNSQLGADRIARWVVSQGFPSSNLIEGFPREVPGIGFVLAYPYLEGRYANPSESDLSRLGTELARLHKSLKFCPWRDEIRDRGLQRNKQLSDLFQNLRRGRAVVGRIPQEVLSFLLEEVEIGLLDVLVQDAQVVHGDLNYGNVLFDDAGNVVFLDYEDTLISWLSPLAELSFVIERFTLKYDDEVALRLARALIRAYDAGGSKPFGRLGLLRDVLRSLSLRSLLLLILVQEHKRWNVPDSEWSKFIFLHRQASSRNGLLKEIEFLGVES